MFRRATLPQEEEEEEGLFKADKGNEEDSERDRATVGGKRGRKRTERSRGAAAGQ